MRSREMEQCQQKLVEIQAISESTAQEVQLSELARKLGATRFSRRGAFNAAGPELIDNIHDALRTKSMISMCKTANRNLWIAFAAAIAAVLSAGAAWIAVCKSY